MIKKLLLIFTVCFLYAQNGLTAGEKEPLHPEDTVATSSKLKGIEESYYGLNYRTVIDKYLPMLDKNFSVTRYRYFVVMSELDENETYDLIDTELHNISSTMQDNYVAKRPGDITAIVIFKDTDFSRYKDFLENKLDIKNVVEKNTGYHSQKRKIIVMRYIKGKGTILHEATHKFMKADFPDAPLWFGEAMASLHESAEYRGGKLMGGFSLRLLTLKTAMVKGTYKNLRTLMETEENEFYDNNSLLNYATARYLMMYLQEKGVLERYYKLYRDTYETDKTGIIQLETVLGKPMNKIELDFIVYIYSFKGIYP